MRTAGLCLLLTIPALLAAQGSYLSYSTYLGGDGEDIIHAVATDSAGNVYLAGETTSSNFPVTAGAFQTKRGNSPGTIFGFTGQYLPNAFVAKLSPAGQILWATYLGGNGFDAALGIAVDAKGSPYVLGYTYSPDFPTTPGAYQTTAPLSNRAFVAKFTPDGSSLAYSTFLSGSMIQIGYAPGGILESAVSPSAIAVDAAGNAFLGGSSNPATLSPTAGACSNTGSAFVAKLDASGSKLNFVTYLGGSGSSDIVHGIALDANGNIYAAGTTGAADFPVTAPFAHTGVGAGGNTGAFLVKLDSAGGHAAYSAVLGGTAPIAGSAFSGATAVAVDSLGSAYLAGYTTATNFPTANAAQAHLAGNTDGFLAKVDPTGSQLVYSTYLGGSGNEQIYGLAVDGALRAYVVGETLSTDFPTTTLSVNFPATSKALPKRFAAAPCMISSATPFGVPMFPVNCGDGFVTQFDRFGDLTYSTYISGSNTDSVNAIATTGTNVWLAGATRSSDFPVAGAAASDHRSPAVCVDAGSPSSSQSYPCDDGFVSNLAFGAPAAAPPLRVVNFASLIDQPVAPAGMVTIFGDSIGPGAVAVAQLGSDGKLATVAGGWQGPVRRGCGAADSRGSRTDHGDRAEQGGRESAYGDRRPTARSPDPGLGGHGAGQRHGAGDAHARSIRNRPGLGDQFGWDGQLNRESSEGRFHRVPLRHGRGSDSGWRWGGRDGGQAGDGGPGGGGKSVPGGRGAVCGTIARNDLGGHANQCATARWSDWRSGADLFFGGGLSSQSGVTIAVK